MGRLRLGRYRHHGQPWEQRGSVDARSQGARLAGERDLAKGCDRYATARPVEAARLELPRRAGPASGHLGLASATSVLAVLAAPPARADAINLMDPPAPHEGLSAYDIDGDFALLAATPAYCQDARALETEQPPECSDYNVRFHLLGAGLGVLMGTVVVWRFYRSRWFYPRWKTNSITAALTEGVMAAFRPNVRGHQRHVGVTAVGLDRVDEIREADPEGFDRQVRQAVERANRLASHLTGSRLWHRPSIRERFGGDFLRWDVRLRGGLLLYWQGQSTGHDLLQSDQGDYFLDLANWAPSTVTDLDAPGSVTHLGQRFDWTNALLRDRLGEFAAQHPDYNHAEALRWLLAHGITPLLELDRSVYGVAYVDFRCFAETLVRDVEELVRVRMAVTNHAQTLLAD
ncbi:MAG: hypothetical protein HY543_10440, partial [Deltaproteobacteria bacterium]|nr:hypothetical protein [Deltaproteobacteria bacterium]